MKTIGTILPNYESLKSGAELYKKEQLSKLQVAKENGLSELETSKDPFGETMYWKTNTIFAIVGRDLNIRWFERRQDGDYIFKS